MFRSSDYKARFNIITKKKNVTFSFLLVTVLPLSSILVSKFILVTGWTSKLVQGKGKEWAAGSEKGCGGMWDLSFLSPFSPCFHCVTNPTASLVHWGSSSNKAQDIPPVWPKTEAFPWSHSRKCPETAHANFYTRARTGGVWSFHWPTFAMITLFTSVKHFVSNAVIPDLCQDNLCTVPSRLLLFLHHILKKSYCT